MYRTCLFCRSDLGLNDTIEALPIGRRVAFDQDRGRLWVVCRRCERWNLTPFDERWEAIEACEREYRATRRRYSTGQVGLARLDSGLELVRIGQPLRPEFAAWRYGDQFGRRRRRHLLIGVAVTAASVGALAAPWLLGTSVLSTLLSMVNSYGAIRSGRRVATVIDGPAGAIPLVPSQMMGSRIRVGVEGELVLRIPHRERGLFAPASGRLFHELTGTMAARAAGRILPRVNAAGAAKRAVADAAKLLDAANDPLDQFTAVASRIRQVSSSGGRELTAVEPELRLALEMAAHEDAERGWLAGELAELEAAWRQAEEIARIADTLAIPAEVESHLERIKTNASPNGSP